VFLTEAVFILPFFSPLHPRLSKTAFSSGAPRQGSAMNADEPQQEQMTVVVLKFKGGSHSLQMGFDAVGQAINALGSGPPDNHRAVVQRQPARPSDTPRIVMAD